MHCEFCGTEHQRTHLVREMMFGTREQFPYLECSGCGRLRISEVPADLGKHYPQSYTAFNIGSNRGLKAWLRQSVVSLAIRNRGFLNAVASPSRFTIAKLAHALRLRREMQILDVGCGAGRLVLDLRAAGFRATGIDRFAPEISDSMGLAVRQGELQDVSEQFDCVMFNHSLEHIADQVETLRMALSKVRANGSCIVRIPIAGWAWKEYGTDWVHLDAPRHLCVHTERSFRLAAGQAGFAVSETVYDSNDFLFWGSELYRRNVPLEDARYRLSDYFSKDCMKKFRRRALELNRQGQGDQAMFFLRRA